MTTKWKAEIQAADVVRCAQHAAQWAFTHLREVHNVPQDIAREAAKSAGDAFAQDLTRALVERDVLVVPKLTAPADPVGPGTEGPLLAVEKVLGPQQS